MSDVNYISPSSVMPKQGYQPTGFLGGMQYAQQMQDYNDLMGLSKLMAQMSAQKEQEDLKEGAPVRASDRLAKIATNTATQQTAVPRALAELGPLQDNARISRAGVDDKILVNHANSIKEQGAAGLAKFQNDLQGAMQLGAILKANGPAGAAMVEQQAKARGLDPDMVKALMTNPDATIAHLQAVDQKLQGELLKQKQDNQQKQTAQESVANIQGKTARDVATIGADSRETIAQFRAALQGQQAKFEQTASALLNKQAALRAQGKDLDPAELDQLNFINQMMIAMRAAGPAQQQVPGSQMGLFRPQSVQPPAPPGTGKPAVAVGQTVQVGGQSVKIIGQTPDGKFRVQGPDGRTGTWDGK